MHHKGVKARLLCILVAVSSFAFAGAQAPQSTWWDRLQATCETVATNARPVADSVAKQFPKRFRALKESALGTVKEAERALDDADLQQKEQFALELWRVRRSLDFAALCSAPVLKELTGLDVPTLDELKARVARVEKALNTQIAKLKD